MSGASLGSLPDEVLLLVLAHLPVADLLAARGACRRLWRLSCDAALLGSRVFRVFLEDGRVMLPAPPWALALSARGCAGLAALAAAAGPQWAALRDLSLQGSPLADAAPLAGCVSLRRLSLADTRVARLDFVRALPRLWALDLTNTAVADLSPLDGGPVTHLDITGTPARRAPRCGLRRLRVSFTEVRALPSPAGAALEALDASFTRGVDLRGLGGALTYLNLSHTLPPAGLGGGWARLRGLLGGARPAGAWVPPAADLGRLSSLTHLDLRHTWFDDAAALRGLRALRVLRLDGTPAALN